MIDKSNSGKRIARVSAFSLAKAESVLKAAELLIIPDDLTQRQTFAQLIPHLYVLRKRGCSFNQLTTLLSQIGVNLQPSTVKSYYWEMLAEKQDICQARMNEQIVLLAKMRKETKDVEITEATQKIIDSMNGKYNTSSVSPALPTPAPPPPVELIATSAPESASTPVPLLSPENGKKLLRKQKPVPGDFVEPQVNEADAGFGLLKKKPGAGEVKKPAFFDADDSAPVIPNLSSEIKQVVLSQPIEAAGSVEGKQKFRCSPLKSGVEPLAHRPMNDQNMYQEGMLEHPEIDGLMLTLNERLFGAHLEYVNRETGEVLIENPTEKRFRVMWKKSLKMQETSTSGNFTKMDLSLFEKP